MTSESQQDLTTRPRTGHRRRMNFIPAVLVVVLSGLQLMPAAVAQDPQAVQIRAQGQEPDPQSPADSPPAEAPDDDTAATTEQNDAPADPSRVLRQRMESIRLQVGNSDLSEADRQQVETLLEQTGRELDLYEQLRQQNTQLKARADGLAETVEKLRAAPDLAKPLIPAALPDDDLEEAVATERVQLESEQQLLEKYRREQEDTASTKQSAQERVDAAEKEATTAALRVKELSSQSTSPLENATYVEAEAFRLKTDADYDLARTALALLNAQLTLDVPQLRVARQQELVRLHSERLQELTSQLDERRKESSRQELERAKQTENRLDSIENEQIRELGELQIELAKENDQLAQHRIPRWTAILERRRTDLSQLKEAGRVIQNRVERFGTDATLGRSLLRFGTELPAVSKLLDEMNEIDQLTAGWQLRILEYNENRDRIKAVADRTRDDATEDETEILNGVTQVLDELEANNDRLFELLEDVNAEDRSTISFIDDWNAFSSEHALWLRSHEFLTTQQVADAVPSTRELGSTLLDSLNAIFRGTGLSLWALVIPAGVAILILLAVQSQAKSRLLKHGETASQSTCMTMRPTVLSLLLSVGMAAEWPLVLMLLGSILRVQSGGVAPALGESLIQLGGIGLWLNSFRQVLRPGGLASSHLKWNPVICERLRRWLRLVLIVLSIPMFLFLLARNVPDETDTLDRVLFLVLMICMTLVLARLLLPVNSHFVQAIISRSRLLTSTRLLWISIILLTPLFLAGLAIVGYYHTALVLWDRVWWSVVSASGIVLVWSLVLRWLRMNHRAMRMALARERARQRELQEETSEVDLAVPQPAQDSELVVFGTQAKQLIRNAAILISIGCAWAIWFDTLPALRVLEHQKLWDVKEQVSYEEKDDTGATVMKTRTETRPVTVVSLMLVVFVATSTWVGVRQLPSLIEVILLRQKHFDAGLRYTITTVVRYLLLVAGCTISFSLMGLRWSQVQWLVAGLSVGLGFGLQEVFANFVSGIIILVERPIRIGDVVTIDGVSGVVSRIQIRATSITDWDRREYIVPNRELVTGKLLNWTLSDSTNRVMIAVGIGYSCDPDKARETMLKIAAEHPNIMDDPGPMATFENFGDSSLDLVLRAYLPDMDNRLSTINDLHTKIHKAFAEEGIDIPFPQREVRML